MNLSKCRRCKKDIKVESRHATNKRFCSTDCYETWWNEYRSKGVTGAEFSAKLWGPVPKVVLEETQKAWLAALIDGEGWIGIVKEKRAGNVSGARYYANVEIANTKRDLLDAVTRCVGEAFVYLKDHRIGQVNHKKMYSVRIKKRAIPSLLEQIKPYLVIKRRQAEIVLELCRVKAETPMRASQNHDIQESLRNQCRALNRRGTTGD